MNALYNLGILMKEKGMYEKARELYMKSIDICKEIGDKRSEGYSKMNLAILNELQGRFNEAKEMYEEVLGQLITTLPEEIIKKY